MAWVDMMACPRSFECEQPEVSLEIGPVPSYANIAASVVSILGSLLIMLVYVLLKDLRNGAQKIITQLAVADFFLAAGFIMGAVNFLTHYNGSGERECPIFQTVCKIQSFITAWASVSSYVWISVLAIYFFLCLHNFTALATRLMPLYMTLAWLGPLLVLLPLLCLGKLGYSRYAASNWCYVEDEDYNQPVSQKRGTTVAVVVAAWLWEDISFVIVAVAYGAIVIRLCKQRRGETVTQQSIDKRLLFIPLLYILLRMWDTVQIVVSLIASSHVRNGCISASWKNTLFVLSILQAIGDGSQGWGNCLLYIFLSQQMRRRLFHNPLKRLVVKYRASGFPDSHTHGPGAIESEATTVMTEDMARRKLSSCPSYTHYTVQSSAQ